MEYKEQVDGVVSLTISICIVLWSTRILKLLARVSLKRQGFAQLLVWMQKLKLCGVHGAGRWGGEFNY